MATLTQGSSGNDVKKLQQALISKGYDLGSAGADGIYGSQTAAAVRKYQQDNGLSVDGIAGTQTQSNLYGSGTASASTKSASTAQRMTGTSAGTAEKLNQLEQGYTPSATVQAAQQYLQQVQAQKPSAYESVYADQIQQAYDAIVNRQPFKYNLDEDAIYGQYLDRYQAQGKLAMEDSIAQAAALTGGYGSTYGQSVGQQTYNAYLAQAQDIIPELYGMAQERYMQEGDQLLQGYQMLADRESDAYGKYRDSVSDYYNALSAATSAYNDAYSREYGEYMDELAYWQDREQMESNDYWARYEAAQPRYSSSGGSSSKANTEDPYVDEDLVSEAQSILTNKGEDALEEWISRQRNTYGTLNDSQIDTLLAALEFPLTGGLYLPNPGDYRLYLEQIEKDRAKGYKGV